jgi:hypothetical protein
MCHAARHDVGLPRPERHVAFAHCESSRCPSAPEQLLLVRRWTDAGLSLDRIRELIAGAPEDPPRRAAPTGSVEVWSRVTVADGLELQLEPGRAGLSPEEVRAFVRGITALYRRCAPTTRRTTMPHHHDEPQVCGLTCVEPGAPAPVLAGVQASGRLDGVLFELTLR